MVRNQFKKRQGLALSEGSKFVLFYQELEVGVDTLDASLLPFVRRLHRILFVFQQDSSIVHTSRETRIWLEAEIVEVMEGAACSPDLFSKSNRKSLKYHRATNLCEQPSISKNEELTAAIREAGARINNQTIQNLVNCMPNRIFEVIQKSGGMSHF